MAQAVPISPQPKVVGTSSGARWPSLSSTSQQQPLQRSSEPTAPEFSAGTGYKSSNSVNVTVSTTPAASTIPRQQKPHYLPSQNQSFDSDRIASMLSPNQSHVAPHLTHQYSLDNGAGRRQRYETSSNNQKFIRESSATLADRRMNVDMPSPGTPKEARNADQNFSLTNSISSAPGTTMVILNADSVITNKGADDSLATITITGVSGANHSSPLSDSKSTSFDDSEEGDEASSRHHSESEHQNLLADIDAVSDGGEDTNTLSGSIVLGDDEDLAITPSLRTYYESCFEQLRQDIAAYNRGSESSKSHEGVDHGHSPPVAASSPAAATFPVAVWGKHPLVKAFFEHSKLEKSELSQIWTLADVNTDGWLNTEEFCVAMHLVVRRVQANLPVPPLLPAHLRPQAMPAIPSPDVIPTSSISAGAIGGSFWSNFGGPGIDHVAIKPSAFDQHPAALEASTLSNSFGTIPAGVVVDQQSALPSPPVVLKDFTNIPPSLDYVSRSNVAQPKPRRVTPDFLGGHDAQSQQQPVTSSSHWIPQAVHHSSSVPPSCLKITTAPVPAPRPRTSANDSNQPAIGSNQKALSKSPSITSPQASLPPAAVPKGPPPKPPPRPAATSDPSTVHRHSRSVSLDLSKKIPEMQQQLAATNPAQHAAPAREFVPTPPHSYQVQSNDVFGSRETRDAQVQTSDDHLDATNGKNAKRLSTAPMLDLSMDIGDGSTRAPRSDQAPVQKQIAGSASAMPGGETDSKDWKKRCDRLIKFNADLEQELKKLSEERVGLETHLTRLRKL